MYVSELSRVLASCPRGGGLSKFWYDSWQFSIRGLILGNMQLDQLIIIEFFYLNIDEENVSLVDHVRKLVYYH